MARSGSVELAALAARLKAAGDRELRLEMLRTMRAIPQPLIGDVRKAALEKLPHAGGLNERVANSPIKVQVRTSPRTAGVRIVATEHDARATNYGAVRHPVFGHTDRWVEQQIPAARGWWTDTLRTRSNRVAASLLTAARRVADRVQR